MGVHDEYGKRLLRRIAEKQFIDWGDETKVSYGPLRASIDGVISGLCAIEIESRVDKQIRGAIVDLLSHILEKKLLVLIPVHMNDPVASAQHCELILSTYKKPGQAVRVVLLKGTGHQPCEDEDEWRLREALRTLGCSF